MKQNIFDNYNINFTKYDFDYLEKNIANYKNQCIVIITSSAYKIDAEMLISKLKKEYRVEINFITPNMCYSNAGVNMLWCALKENARLIIALGDEHIHNVCKLLSLKAQLPYCFLSRDFPNLLSTQPHGITFDNSSLQNKKVATCLFKNYNLENISLESCAYAFAQSFALCLLPFENFIYSKLSNNTITTKKNNFILSKLQNLLNYAKGCSFNNKKSIILASKNILKLSLLLTPNELQNEIFEISKKYVFFKSLNTKYFPLYNFFTSQILIKCLNQYFFNNLNSPLSLSLTKIFDLQYNKNKINNILLDNYYDLDKLNYIFKTHKKMILSWLQKLDKLQNQFTLIIKSILPDSGYIAFNQIDYKAYISFIKIQLINIENTELTPINLVSII